MESSGGDGIYIQNASDVSVIRVDSNDHYRQGMSVIDVSGLTVLNSSFRNTNGTAPMAGIDIEPSNGIDQIEQIKISNCLMANNSGSGIDISLGFIISQPRPVSIHVAKVTLRNNSAGVSASNLVDLNGSVGLENVLVDGTCGGAIGLKNKGTDGPNLSFSRITVKDHGQATSGFRPHGCESFAATAIYLSILTIGTYLC